MLIKYIQNELFNKIKNLLMSMIMMELNFLCKKKILARLKQKATIYVFCYEGKLVFPIYISDQKFENSMDLLLIMMTSHITCTSKILTNLCFTKQRIKTKNIFSRVVYSVLVVKMC